VGTAFVVRTGTSSAEPVSVSVTEGEVTLGSHSSTQPPASLRAGDRGELRPNGNVIVLHGTASDADTAWTRGVLVYRAAPLEVVREDVRRWFGIDLKIADTALASRRLTATLDATDAQQVLRTIALALGAEVERTGDIATLRSAARPR
jgi:transmembrane sensor